MSLLFSPIKIRDLEIRNRVFVSPMCQYSAQDGAVSDWHMVHLGSRAVGGAGLVMVEATGVCPEGRITPGCVGLWNQTQLQKIKPIVQFIQSQGAKTAIQLAHAGRKASCDLPWNGGKPLSKEQGAWQTLGPSQVAFGHYPAPREMTEKDISLCIEQFENSTRLALQAGFDVIEIHMAHGYLFHEFLSPLSNLRKDSYGGSLENRMRFSLETARRVRALWPKEKPLFVRISASDWMPNGWDVEQSIVLARELKKLGVDLIDCSSGGNIHDAKIPLEPGYQVPFAEKIRTQAEILTGAVGLITEAEQAESILQTQKADVIFLARALLRDPYWPLHAAKKLNAQVKIPEQYSRAF